MDFNNLWKDLPIVLLYNIDPSWTEQDIQECQAAADTLAEAMIDIGHNVDEVCVQSAELETLLEGFNPDEHLILNWCEEFPGVPHSEYLVAQTLESLGFTFTGAGSHTLSLGQHKPRVKRLLNAKNITTPTWKVYSSPDQISWSHFPAIVKLAYEHCSYGITRESVVQSAAELEQRVEFVINKMHQPALVEEFIDGREFHVGVVGNSHITVLPPGEIDYSPFEDIHDRLCTYESNFDPSSLAYRLTFPKLPVVLAENLLRKLEEMAAAAYKAAGCRDYARMDIRLKDETFYLLDVNPNPDISEDTSLVRGAGLMGLSYGEFGSMLINLAARRHPIYDSRIQTNLQGENNVWNCRNCETANNNRRKRDA
jgi:D-alanine-D-alanine ligase